MRHLPWVVFVVFLAARMADAQGASCRQSWMPSDAPAFCSWQSEPSLPEARTYLAVATSGTSIYVMGGFQFESTTNQVIYYNSVLRSVVGADGRLGPWTTQPSFLNGRSGAGAVATGSCMYLAGGSSSTPSSLTYYDDTQYARIGSNGMLSAWSTSPNHLRVPRSNLSLIAITTDQGIFLNAVAGVAQIGADTVHLDTIEVAKVNSDCSIGPWMLADYHLKGGRSSPQAVVVRDSVVVVGGWGDLDLIDVYDDVQVSAERADGSPSPWRTSPAHLTTGIYGHGTVVTESPSSPSQSLLLSVGGQPGTGSYANWVSYAYVRAGSSVSDAIGIWRIAPSGKLPTGLAGIGVAASNGRIYVIGGSDGNGKYHSDVLSAQFDFGKP